LVVVVAVDGLHQVEMALLSVVAEVVAVAVVLRQVL
jgi:hypothetical protein